MYKEISSINVIKEYFNYKKEVTLFDKVGYKKTDLNVSINSTKTPETYIFIIGESTSKYHMQLYGYERKTTPKLEGLKKELILFNRVKSSHVHTVESLKDIFVLTDKNNNFTSNTLIDCFNQAGFSTFWLSNQSYLGENETPVSAIAKNTSHQVYVNSANGNNLDETLLPKLQTILKKKDNKKVVFLHLMGTHLSYQNRYPKEFNVFNETNISIFGEHADSYINQYDNATLYNDHIVSEVIRAAKNINGLAAVTYFSDHGDEVYDYRNFHGHSGAMQSKYMTDVPFLIWTNNMLKEKNKPLLEGVENNLNQQFSLKNFNHTIQDFFNVKSNYFQPKKSYFSEKDSVSSQLKIQYAGMKKSGEEPYTFDSKIWVHRVNSLERLAKIQHLFKGMELDAVFENGKLDIRHPPVKSINLSFEEFLSNVKNPDDHYFWIDLKNLSPKNAKEINQRLNYLAKKFNIRNNIIIETRSPKAIPEINVANYYSSYYLPNLASLNENNLSKNLKIINQNIIKNKATAISQNYNNYYIMKSHFSSQNKLIWALNLNWNDTKTHMRIEKLLKKDTTIKVCLVNYKTGGWR